MAKALRGHAALRASAFSVKGNAHRMPTQSRGHGHPPYGARSVPQSALDAAGRPLIMTFSNVRVSSESESMSTTIPAKGDIEQGWHLIDAADQVVGRLAVTIANILRGKHRPIYTPNMDTGEFVVVI